MWPQVTSSRQRPLLPFATPSEPSAAPTWKRERETMKARKRNYGKRKRNCGSKKLVRSRRNGRAWARGRKEWGKSVGSARGTCRQCVGESPSESAFIGHLLLLLPVGERPELPWSTLLCGSSVVAGQQPVCCVLSHGGDEALLSMKSHSYFGRRLCWSATYKQLFEPAL